MKNELVKISLRQSAVYLEVEFEENIEYSLNETTSILVANAAKLGFVFSEALLHALNNLNAKTKMEFLELLKEQSGVKKNWTPLVKEWGRPTGESISDHMITFFSNFFPSTKGSKLVCGHFIPEGSFPLERYNGCPYCGTPFEFSNELLSGQGSTFKTLDLWTEKEMKQFLSDLLQSKTALDATQVDSLMILLTYFSLPEVEIQIKETLMLVIDIMRKNEQVGVVNLFKTPTDILRYLWYKHTGSLQIIEPKTIRQREGQNAQHFNYGLDKEKEVTDNIRNKLKLKYTRAECKEVARWLNTLELDVEVSCEMMHPKREMWVRFIRALRLAEYSKKAGFLKLKSLLDCFYNETYNVWQGDLNAAYLSTDEEKYFAMIKQRPGIFTRSLFATILWFGLEVTLKHYKEITSNVPARLLLTITMYAQNYFDKDFNRSVKPLGGVTKMIPANKMLALYEEEQLKEMIEQIKMLYLEVMGERFSTIETEAKNIYIDKSLYKIPLSIGDRSDKVQDLPSALMGSRFEVEGETVRLFMQWGEGLPAQHLDMDLSCMVAYEKRSERCSYSQLSIRGCQHSGDIQSIPSMVGTAEYIDIDMAELRKENAKYVTFTCNAYSEGSITPNLVVGWMDSKHPMKVGPKGVAYDPSCVQHQIRVTQGSSKGLVFGVLDIEKEDIIWLEMSYHGQIVQNLDQKGVESMIAKLDAKLSVGELLELKASSQNLVLVSQEEADEVYNREWARNIAAITQLFVD